MWWCFWSVMHGGCFLGLNLARRCNSANYIEHTIPLSHEVYFQVGRYGPRSDIREGFRAERDQLIFVATCCLALASGNLQSDGVWVSKRILQSRNATPSYRCDWEKLPRKIKPLRTSMQHLISLVLFICCRLYTSFDWNNTLLYEQYQGRWKITGS